MTRQTLDGLKVAILVADGFEQIEMTEPRKALDAAGAETWLISPKPGRVRAWNLTEWGDTFTVDVRLDQAGPEDFEVLLLPGGGHQSRPAPDVARSRRLREGFPSTRGSRSLRSAMGHGP